MSVAAPVACSPRDGRPWPEGADTQASPPCLRALTLLPNCDSVPAGAWPPPGFYPRRQTSRLGVLCRALDPGQPPGQAACDSAHTDDVYGRTIPHTLGGGSRGNPGWQMPAGCFHRHLWRASSTPATAQFGGRGGSRTRESACSSSPNTIPTCCLLADNRERCFHFTGRGSLLPTCGGGGVPVCSAHLGRAPGSPGGRSGDLASLPHDPSTPSCQTSSAESPCPWEAALPPSLPNPRSRGPGSWTPTPSAGCRWPSALQGKFYLRDPLGSRTCVLRETGCSQE